MATYSTQLDPFFDQLEIDANAGNFGPSYVEGNFKNARAWHRALVQMAYAEMLSAMGDNATITESGVQTAAKFDGQKIITEGQKQTYGTGALSGQTPYAAQSL